MCRCCSICCNGHKEITGNGLPWWQGYQAAAFEAAQAGAPLLLFKVRPAQGKISCSPWLLRTSGSIFTKPGSEPGQKYQSGSRRPLDRCGSKLFLTLSGMNIKLPVYYNYYIFPIKRRKLKDVPVPVSSVAEPVRFWCGSGSFFTGSGSSASNQ